MLQKKWQKMPELESSSFDTEQLRQHLGIFSGMWELWDGRHALQHVTAVEDHGRREPCESAGANGICSWQDLAIYFPKTFQDDEG